MTAFIEPRKFNAPKVGIQEYWVVLRHFFLKFYSLAEYKRTTFKEYGKFEGSTLTGMGLVQPVLLQD